MKKKPIILVASLLCLLLLATSCAAPSYDFMRGFEAMNEDEVSKEMNAATKEVLMNFSLEMFKESSQKSGNLMVSPASIYLALGMTLNGADNETKEAMIEALSAKGISQDDLNAGLKSWMNSLVKEGGKVELSIGNSIWYRDGFEADQSFLQKNADYYFASIKSLDFSKKESIDIINEWVRSATKDTIDKIVDSIDENTIMYIINAIYFKGDWKEPFDANNTRTLPFYAPSGVVESDFMNRTGNIDYLTGDHGAGILLPYMGDQYALLALLPEEGSTPRELIENLTAQEIGALLKSKKTLNLALSFPKFESNYEDSLIDELSKMGMEIAFDPGRADFSLMSKDLSKDVFISDVKHKTFIRVDEKGSEASAVTSVEMTTTSMPIEVQKLVFDKPFVYSIVNLDTGLPIFMGIMENPSLQ